MKRIALVSWAWLAVACGGSSSETPFPQAPLDPKLQARHDAASAAQAAEEGPGSALATSASPSASSMPAAAPAAPSAASVSPGSAPNQN